MSNAQATDPTACADRQVMIDVRSAYDSHSKSSNFPALVEMGTPVDAGVVDDAPALKKKPGSKFGKSRFCEAPLLLADGQEDRVYYRIDEFLDRSGPPYMISPCFASMAVLYSTTVDIICAPRMPPR